MLNVLHFSMGTLRIICAVPSTAVFCSSFISCFPGMLLRLVIIILYCLYAVLSCLKLRAFDNNNNTNDNDEHNNNNNNNNNNRLVIIPLCIIWMTSTLIWTYRLAILYLSLAVFIKPWLSMCLRVKQ